MASVIPSDRWINPDDFMLAHALERIRNDYGKICYIKPKALRKFGRTSNADDGVRTTMATFPGDVVNETMRDTNAYTSIVSSNAGDDQVVTIEGHTIDGSGNLTFAVQSATLNGQTAVTLGTALARVNRVYIANASFGSNPSAFAGNVSVYFGAATSGVPDNDDQVGVYIPAGKTQTQKAQTAISQSDYFIITSVAAGISRGSGNINCDIELEIRQLGGVWRPAGLELKYRSQGTNQFGMMADPCIIVPSNADVRMVCTATAANSSASGFFAGYLALVDRDG